MFFIKLVSGYSGLPVHFNGFFNKRRENFERIKINNEPFFVQ